MNCNWIIEKSSFDEKYYNLILKPESIYQNEMLDRIERAGFLSLLRNQSLNKILPLSLAPLVTSKGRLYYYSQSSQKSKKASRTIIAISTIISNLSKELLIDELNRIKKDIEGDVFIYISDSWEGEERSLLQILNVFMVVLGYVPAVIEFQTLGWSSDLKDSAFYLLGQRWFCSDSFFQHFLLSKGAKEIHLHPRKAGKIVEETKISPYHSMYVVKTEITPIAFDQDDLMSLQVIL